QRARGDPRLIQRFTIELRTGGDELRARGDVWGIPPPSPWPGIAGGGVFGVVILVGARTRWSVPWVGSALGVVLVATAVHAVGAWSASSRGTANRLADTLPTPGALRPGGVAG